MRDVFAFATADVRDTMLETVRRLLDLAFDGEFSDEDWEHTLGGRHVVVTDSQALVAHAAVVPRTLEIDGRSFRAGYVEGVATDPRRQGEGFGTIAMRTLNDLVRDHSEVGALSTDRHGFYERLGWERWRGPTYVRSPGGLVRTEEEDDGIMVLRFGTSAELPLDAAMVCEARRGDDW